MEIAGADGTKVEINRGETLELGRGHGFNSSDKTISRRQVSFFIPKIDGNREVRAQFEVLGRNPIYVSRNNGVEILRRFERGEMESGNMFCVSAKDPVWYTLRGIRDCGASVRRNDLEREVPVNLDSGEVEDFQLEDVDISDIDPVKEFGFFVIGHELDLYPKILIRDVKKWDWFLDEGRGNEDDDENGGKKGRKKRKKGAEVDDEDWTSECDEDSVLVNKPKIPQKPKYAMRSKDRGKASKASDKGKKIGDVDDEVDDEDEDDETLGGFIVDDENLDDDKEIGEEEDEEEEEFVDEDDE
ncbi:uncharacterized protein LOC127266225 [Andrographis paniculata]|uniref:uncharacterized protein LOC127266225 n=1 Tax=Andrographis paniculata TaxID=175694 RepID=UPI0021E808CC|nr:uncharacterized protein LOC127266225 [Andrographis paniculata]